jgi:hypothetical protein
MTVGEPQLSTGRQEHVPSEGTFKAMTENVVRPVRPGRPLPRIAPLAVLGIASFGAAAAVIALLVGSHGKTNGLPPVNGGPALVSQAQLRQLAAASDQPVYWVGPKAGYSYELTRTASGRVYVRYLPAGVKAGDPRASFLVVGTYTQPGSFANLQRAGKARGAVALRISNGGLVVFSSSKPTSVYVGYPGAGYQVEVYSPSADTARSLVLADKIRPIG